MPVHLMLSTTLRDHIPGYDPLQGLSLELQGRTTVRGLAEQLGLPLPQIKIVMLNGRRAGLDEELAEGDRLALFPAIGGG